jgi:hypothetical protein
LPTSRVVRDPRRREKLFVTSMRQRICSTFYSSAASSSRARCKKEKMF